MPERLFPTITGQVAAHLREQILRSRRTMEMPGRHELASELGPTHIGRPGFVLRVGEGVGGAVGGGGASPASNRPGWVPNQASRPLARLSPSGS